MLSLLLAICSAVAVAEDYPTGMPGDVRLLAEKWFMANDDCRGGYPDEIKTKKACKVRDLLTVKIEKLGWCYGEFATSGVDMYWGKCGIYTNHNPVILHILDWQYRFAIESKVFYKARGYYIDGKTGTIETLIDEGEVIVPAKGDDNFDALYGKDYKYVILSHSINCIDKTATYELKSYLDKDGRIIVSVVQHDKPFKYDDYAELQVAAWRSCGNRPLS